MKIITQEAEKFEDLDFTKWDIGFIGSALDDRGNSAVEFIKKNCIDTFEVDYNADEMELVIGDNTYIVDLLDEYFTELKDKKVLIESTTMNFSEILLLLSCLKNVNSEITILYLEPQSYERKRTSTLIDKRQFELSGETPVYKPIPGFAGLLNQDSIQKVLFMTGYESERIDRAIEENTVTPRNCSLMFGVPAFQAGWEMNSFSNNVRVIRDLRLEGGIYFAGANNPCAVYDAIQSLYDSLLDSEELYLVPVGTKPAGIATAIFAVQNPDVSILYDHPKKKFKRTKKIEKWHLFDIII